MIRRAYFEANKRRKYAKNVVVNRSAPDKTILKIGQGHSDPKMACDILPSQDTSIHQTWNSYLKEYRRYAPDSMLILETRSEAAVPKGNSVVR